MAEIMKPFSQFIIEDALPEKAVVFVFGRFNPPTKGHELLFNIATKLSKRHKADLKIFASQSNDPKKNPLEYASKIKFMRKMFPKLGRSIIKDDSIRVIFDVLVYLYDQKYTKIVMVAGSDRITEFENIINKYNGTTARHGFYDFNNIEIVSAGERDPDTDDTSGVSASKAREAVANDDLDRFTTMMPDRFKQVENLYNAVRKGMNL